MNAQTHAMDAQLPLSILFLAITENARQEPQRGAIVNRDIRPNERETTYEEPERWDGMW